MMATETFAKHHNKSVSCVVVAMSVSSIFFKGYESCRRPQPWSYALAMYLLTGSALDKLQTETVMFSVWKSKLWEVCKWTKKTNVL